MISEKVKVYFEKIKNEILNNANFYDNCINLLKNMKEDGIDNLEACKCLDYIYKMESIKNNEEKKETIEDLMDIAYGFCPLIKTIWVKHSHIPVRRKP